MANSLMELYGGGMTGRPTNYQIGGQVARSRRTRAAQKELRRLRDAAAEAARKQKEAQQKGQILGTIGAIAGSFIPIPGVGTLLGSAIGSGLGRFLGQAAGESFYQGTDVGEGRYAKRTREDLQGNIDDFKKSSLERAGIAGLQQGLKTYLQGKFLQGPSTAGGPSAIKEGEGIFSGQYQDVLPSQVAEGKLGPTQLGNLEAPMFAKGFGEFGMQGFTLAPQSIVSRSGDFLPLGSMPTDPSLVSEGVAAATSLPPIAADAKQLALETQPLLQPTRPVVDIPLEAPEALDDVFTEALEPEPSMFEGIDTSQDFSMTIPGTDADNLAQIDFQQPFGMTLGDEEVSSFVDPASGGIFSRSLFEPAIPDTLFSSPADTTLTRRAMPFVDFEKGGLIDMMQKFQVGGFVDEEPNPFGNAPTLPTLSSGLVTPTNQNTVGTSSIADTFDQMVGSTSLSAGMGTGDMSSVNVSGGLSGLEKREGSEGYTQTTGPLGDRRRNLQDVTRGGLDSIENVEDVELEEGGVGPQNLGRIAGYGTAIGAQSALRQLGMLDVANDPRLQEYLDELPQFSQGYRQQLQDIRSGARENLANLYAQQRMGGTGLGVGTGMQQFQQRLAGLSGDVERRRRGVVEGFQSDLLSSISDIERLGEFEFGSV
jgi:hypothetical protein